MMKWPNNGDNVTIYSSKCGHYMTYMHTPVDCKYLGCWLTLKPLHVVFAYSLHAFAIDALSLELLLLSDRSPKLQVIKHIN